MNVLTLQSTYGGLLHDTGKAVYRAGGQRGSHSEQGYQFLHSVLPGARLGTGAGLCALPPRRRAARCSKGSASRFPGLYRLSSR